MYTLYMCVCLTQIWILYSKYNLVLPHIVWESLRGSSDVIVGVAFSVWTTDRMFRGHPLRESLHEDSKEAKRDIVCVYILIASLNVTCALAQVWNVCPAEYLRKSLHPLI